MTITKKIKTTDEHYRTGIIISAAAATVVCVASFLYLRNSIICPIIMGISFGPLLYIIFRLRRIHRTKKWLRYETPIKKLYAADYTFEEFKEYSHMMLTETYVSDDESVKHTNVFEVTSNSSTTEPDFIVDLRADANINFIRNKLIAAYVCPDYDESYEAAYKAASAGLASKKYSRAIIFVATNDDGVPANEFVKNLIILNSLSVAETLGALYMGEKRLEQQDKMEKKMAKKQEKQAVITET